jgi:hypothetical protein
MQSLKFAHLVRERTGEVCNFYIDSCAHRAKVTMSFISA